MLYYIINYIIYYIICLDIYTYIYIYMYIYEQGPPHPPLPQPDGSQQPKPIYTKYIAQCKECASNAQGTA